MVLATVTPFTSTKAEPRAAETNSDCRPTQLYGAAVMRARHSAVTDTGLRRQRNEDAFLADDGLGLYLVCDGVGGRAHGEVASAATADLIWDWIKREDALISLATAETRAGSHHAARVANVSTSPSPQTKMSEDTVGRLGAMIRGAVQNACYMVHSMGEVYPERRGMSTTASVVQLVGEMIVVGQVGDSRVYLARDGAVTQLTEDHTWQNLLVQQGRLTPRQARGRAGKNIITRAVGLREFVEVDILVLPVQPGDRVLLCSDGLHAYLDSGATLSDLFKLDIREAAPRRDPPRQRLRWCGQHHCPVRGVPRVVGGRWCRPSPRTITV